MSDFKENMHPDFEEKKNLPTENNETSHKVSFMEYLKSKEFWSINLLFIAGGFFFLFLFLYAVLPIITKKGSEKELPNLTGKKLSEALQVIEEMGLRYQVDSLTYDPDIPPLTLLSQNPAPGHKVKPKRTVYLNVNKRQPTLVEIPPYSEYVSLEDYIHYLQTRGFRVGKIDSVIRNDAPGQVVGVFLKNKRVQDGDKIPKGSIVNIQVSKYPHIEETDSLETQKNNQ